jgi:hypothetical protein
MVRLGNRTKRTRVILFGISDRESVQVNCMPCVRANSTRNRLSNWRNRDRCYRTLDRENGRIAVAAKGQLTGAKAVEIGACCKTVGLA